MNEDTTQKLRSLAIDRASGDPAEAGGARVWMGVAAMAVLVAIAAVAWALTRPAAPTGLADASSPSPSTSSQAAAGADEPRPAARPAGALVATGYVVARRRATVSTEIAGRLESLLVEEGDYVEEGETLAFLDAELAEIDLKLAEASAASADAGVEAVVADLRDAERALVRARELQSSQFASEASLDAAIARVESLRARLRGAEADAAVARRTAERRAELLDRYIVRAPFAGVVVDRNAQVGEIVSPSSAGGGFTRTGVYTLVDMNSLEIEVDVNEGQIGRIEPGGRAEAVLDAYPDWTIPASVAAIIPTANRDRATIQVRVAFDETDPRILPDMAARVTFLTDAQTLAGRGT